MESLPTNVQNDINLHAANVQALALQEASRPGNTARAYAKRKEEWQRFCRRREFNNSEVVTKNKLLVFLQEEVLNRPLRGKDDDSTARLGASSVETYVSAVVSIYNNQVTRGLNHNPHPRGPAVKAMLAAHSRKERQRRRDAYKDRGKGTIQNGYKLDDMRRLVSTLWDGSGEACEQNLRTALVSFFVLWGLGREEMSRA
jgi:hypothetical protein